MKIHKYKNIILFLILIIIISLVIYINLKKNHKNDNDMKNTCNFGEKALFYVTLLQQSSILA